MRQLTRNEHAGAGGELNSAPVLVAIAGGSGSGKSWLAGQLQQRLGKDAGILSLDDFYLDRSRLTPAQRKRINFDHPRAIDWLAFNHVLREIRLGRPVKIPCYDFATHSRAEEGRTWKPRPLVLVEGLWVLRTRALRAHFSCSIFVDCPEEVRFERRLMRDAAQRGRTEESIQHQFMTMTAPMHNRHVSPQSRRAALAVPSPMRDEELEQLAEHLKYLKPREVAYE
jgi:uridine kinase